VGAPAGDDEVDPPCVPWWWGAALPAVGFVVIGLFYGFPLGILLHHHRWLTPPDLWRAFDAARYFVRGDLSKGLHYVSTPGLVSTPATAILVAPPAELAYRLHEAAGWPVPLGESTAWIVLGPYITAVGSSFIFAVDALARRLGLAADRRALLDWISVPFALVVAVAWGHPEDVVALGLGLYGFAMAIEGRWSKVGWLFSTAACLQPLSLLLLPPVLALTGPRQWGRVLLRVPLLTLLVMAVPLVVDGGDVIRFIREPIDVVVNHPMPLSWISPSDGVHLISPAPERAAALVVSAVIGWWAWRDRATPMEVVWYGGLAMACRFFLEPVVTPYYLWPAVALLLVIVVARPSTRGWLSAYLLIAASMLAYVRLEPWVYFLSLLAMMAAALAMTWAALHVEVGVAAGGAVDPSPATPKGDVSRSQRPSQLGGRFSR
jgi:hypothetical protein